MLSVKTDITNEKDVKEMVNRTINEFGKIDTLVNNAGIYPMIHTHLTDFPIEYWDKTMSVNLRGVFLCCKYALPIMIHNRRGSIINLSSVASHRSVKGRIAYGVSKAGVERLTFGLAEEVKDYNIAINSLCPTGLTDTKSAREAFPNERFETWVNPIDIAIAARWLACQNAKTFTGNAVAVPPGGKSIYVYARSSVDRIVLPIE